MEYFWGKMFPPKINATANSKAHSSLQLKLSMSSHRSVKRFFVHIIQVAPEHTK